LVIYIYNAINQHCAPQATLKPVRFQFTPKTVICSLMSSSAQVCWEAVSNTWPSGTLPNVTCCVCVGQHTICRWTSYYQSYYGSKPSKKFRTRKPCYRKDDRAMRPIYGCPEKFRESSQTPPAILFPKFVKGFCSDRY